MSKRPLIALLMIELFLYYIIPVGLFFLSNNLVQCGMAYLKEMPLIGTPAAYLLGIVWSFFCVLLISMVYSGVCCQIKYSIRERMILWHLVKSDLTEARAIAKKMIKQQNKLESQKR